MGGGGELVCVVLKILQPLTSKWKILFCIRSTMWHFSMWDIKVLFLLSSLIYNFLCSVIIEILSIDL